MFGCAGMIAGVALLLGGVCSLFVPNVTLGERLMIALFPAGCAFIAACMLMGRDLAKFRSTKRSVWKKLVRRPNVSEQQFVSHFPEIDSALLAQTRLGISKFFEVPVQKIHPTDDLRKDLQGEKLEPSFQLFVLTEVLAAQGMSLTELGYNTSQPNNIGELAREIQRVIDKNGTAISDDENEQKLSQKSPE